MRICRNVFQFYLSGDQASAICPGKGVAEFEKVKIGETIKSRGDKSCRSLHKPLWQVDSDKIRRMAPIEFIGRSMPVKCLVRCADPNASSRLLRFGIFIGDSSPVAKDSAAKKTTLGYPIGWLPTFCIQCLAIQLASSSYREVYMGSFDY